MIQKLASDGVGNVFATDLILATLMAATRSVNSWDIIAYRVGDKLFFDKRSTGGVSSPVGKFISVFSALITKYVKLEKVKFFKQYMLKAKINWGKL